MYISSVLGGTASSIVYFISAGKKSKKSYIFHQFSEEQQAVLYISSVLGETARSIVYFISAGKKSKKSCIFLQFWEEQQAVLYISSVLGRSASIFLQFSSLWRNSKHLSIVKQCWEEQQASFYSLAVLGGTTNTVVVPLFVFCSSFLFDANNEVYPEGHKIRRLKLAETLKTIAREGADAFYNGSLTDDVVADIQDNGSVNTVAPVSYTHLTLPTNAEV